MYLILLFTLAIIFGNSCDSPAQSTLEKIKSLELNETDGDIPAYYTEGFEERAKETLDFLRYSKEYFEENFQVSQFFSLAVLDSASWIKITRIPYGLPFVSGPPYVVCIPASTDNVLARIVSGGLTDHDFSSSYSMTRDEIVNRFISLIGFHELGHIYANEYGMSFPNKWTYEFAATYFAFSYMEDRQPEMSRLWLDVSEALLEEIEPEHRSLSDFEELYVRVGVEDYAWYQMVFLQRVKEVYDRKGNEFTIQYKSHSWPTESENHYLGEMKEIVPGFLDWASNMGLLLAFKSVLYEESRK
ncbi:MAG: hypothetical protein ACOCZL_01080, partial [Bacteroidota bacterium]